VELKQIKELMAAMGRTGTKRLSLKKDDFELQLEREEHGVYRGGEGILELGDETPLKNDQALRANAALSKGRELTTPVATPSTATAIDKEETNALYVTSPMVGTFYNSPSPEDPPFVKAGDKIDKNTVMCIIEAMKVMNEVKAGVTGTVVECLVESGHPVEFGTKLFKIA
jgi:acetyl-CoA carboxylase biotin carboxyl carrier protein